MSTDEMRTMSEDETLPKKVRLALLLAASNLDTMAHEVNYLRERDELNDEVVFGLASRARESVQAEMAKLRARLSTMIDPACLRRQLVAHAAHAEAQAELFRNRGLRNKAERWMGHRSGALLAIDELDRRLAAEANAVALQSTGT